ncbi:MAG: ribosome biogenesis protein [Nitrosopumilus sp.]|nr:ribosome biogenesis protein [Nitrosopumilus sp.]CAI9831807.1 Ribosomal RNA small subunit methyltransferase Nep1 [Nitrosopumilaceae archaeon]MDA7942155.1 ribosome biogenesis protein [Nitrosopumilus sp.]MDA7943993.1 ribosome biogenesis protein [Nitrosopumilus sp.]MDA7953710.1 ribosome biogenesis protein [Nitrosopumilus sp.]
MTTLLIAEAALETVPRELGRHPSVASHARRLGRDPQDLLLDNSWHYAAMKGLPGAAKRGRPDLVHHALLEATSTPMYAAGRLDVLVHTVHDRLIRLGAGVRLPRSYHRFAGLASKLFREGRVSSGSVLLEISESDVRGALDGVGPSSVAALSPGGTRSTYREVASGLDDDSCIIVGGFQRGEFSAATLAAAGPLVSVEDEPVEAHVVISRILYECEQAR